jgi:hypothetical protein
VERAGIVSLLDEAEEDAEDPLHRGARELNRGRVAGDRVAEDQLEVDRVVERPAPVCQRCLHQPLAVLACGRRGRRVA